MKSDKRLTLRVVPESADARTIGLSAFILCDFVADDVAPIVIVETTLADVYHTDSRDVAAYDRLWHGLWADALSAKDTRAWLTRVRDAGR